MPISVMQRQKEKKVSCVQANPPLHAYVDDNLKAMI